MASSFSEESVEKKLKTVNNTQDSIQSLSLWIIHHKSHHERIVELWLKVLKKTVHPSHRLTLLYLCNDVVQTCKKKKAAVYNATFKEHLREAASLVRDVSVKGKVERIFNIWQERGVYESSFIKTLQKTLNGSPASTKDKKHRKHKKHALASSTEVNAKAGGISSKAKKVEEDGPISPPSTPPAIFTADKQDTQEVEERDPEESARILAEFKPHEMIEQITAFHRHNAEMQLKVSQLSNLKLDASNLEAIKHLKDRAHGNDFSSHFEDSCYKLEDLVKRQTQHRVDQLVLLETLKTSETFYEEQYREAKIVANAYKNYGARINNMKKRLDELKKSMPAPDSPFPSPDINAPSPGNTPPHVAGGDYSFAGKGDSGYQQNNAWMYGASGNTGMVSSAKTDIDDAFDVSPPQEAPSPDGTPPDLNFGGSESTSASFESRLATFFNQGGSSGPAVYTPRLSSHKSSYKSGDDNGNTTPLDDETPTTPVQDEPSSPPPPKKENPIDFLSRLISQTNKNPAPKSGTSSFLDTLSLLSNVNQKPVEPMKESTPSPQQSWSDWKAKSNGSNSSPSSQPSSPTSQFTVPPPQMVPPPPIPMPVPPPPMALSMGLTMPPPPPPPFTSLDFSSPPPGFQQQTSPGQKENWPESNPSSQSGESSPTGRPGTNSVLKELLPMESFDSKPVEQKASTSLIDPDAMEIVSDEEDGEMDQGIDAGDAKMEFAQKLKQKTQAGGSLKSHVFKPNASNLLTLTGSEDIETILSDDDSPLSEDKPSWPTKSHKSHKKSRSRSRSRERSHKHKKKKKHKRNHSDDDDLRLLEAGDDGKMGSVVKRVDSRSRSSRDSRGDKYEDKYDDRKYDKYDDRDRDFRDKQRSGRSSKDYRDPVEAYTQAYRDAMFQQFNQGRVGHFSSMPLDPRHSSYGKY